MASSEGFHAVRVERVRPLDPTMRRVTFAPIDGEALPQDRPHGGHCRLRFPECGTGAPARPRAFTYRHWHADGRFDVDFVFHAGDGPAARWLRQTHPGDRIAWRHGGPPKISLDRPADDRTILVSDLSGLPVMAALAERAHPVRQVELLLLAPPEARPDIAHTDGRPFTVRQLSSPDAVEAHLCRHASPHDTLVFAACEASQMRRYRRLLLDDLGLPGSRVITSGYWKDGLTTEEVDLAKRRPDWFGDESPHSGTLASPWRAMSP
jgi:NADPH-dependent ferric siderophore reductase